MFFLLLLARRAPLLHLLANKTQLHRRLSKQDINHLAHRECLWHGHPSALPDIGEAVCGLAAPSALSAIFEGGDFYIVG